jgi:hypothetical protein
MFGLSKINHSIYALNMDYFLLAEFKCLEAVAIDLS